VNLFIMHVHTQQCACGREGKLSQLYRPEVAGAATRLAPHRGPVPDDAIITVQKQPIVQVAVCDLCVPSGDEYNRRALRAAEAWAETVRRKRGEALLPSEENRRRRTEAETAAAKRAKLEELA
jgi:hypothetical protein